MMILEQDIPQNDEDAKSLEAILRKLAKWAGKTAYDGELSNDMNSIVTKYQ
jgi:hypothetical protein